MNRMIKIWLIVATSLILLGGVIFVFTMMNLHWDFSKLSIVKFETNSYTISEGVRHISLHTSTADVKFLPSENGECKVVCYETKKEKHAVTVEEGVLVISEMDTRKWYDCINFFSFGSSKITIWLPESAYGDLTTKQSTGNIELIRNITFDNVAISTSTGDIVVSDVSADKMKLSVTTGKITAKSITCQGDLSVTVTTGKTDITELTCRNFLSSGNTGNITLQNVIASEKFSIERSTGDVTLDRCDAADLFITTDTGDVKGTLLTDKVFIAQTDTGHVDVPKTITGGRCEITTDTGNIQFR